jgi:tocopherol O-methyltransferase
VESARERRANYRENVEIGFDTLANLYYAYWGENFHLALDEDDDIAAAYQRTHEEYLTAIGGARARRIVELGCGGGALAEWLADQTTGHVLGVDMSGAQLARAGKRLATRRRRNLAFLRHDIMELPSLHLAPFDAAISLDVFCYLPDRGRALRGVAAILEPGARFLLVDWCRTSRPTRLQRELILEPIYRNWGIGDLETIAGYRGAFRRAGFHILELQDLSGRVGKNWERGYRAALRALADPLPARYVVTLGRAMATHGVRLAGIAKGQFLVALLAKAAADSGILRYVSILVQRR